MRVIHLFYDCTLILRRVGGEGERIEGAQDGGRVSKGRILRLLSEDLEAMNLALRAMPMSRSWATIGRETNVVFRRLAIKVSR